MMLAQGMVEYGGLSSVIGEARRLTGGIQNWFEALTPGQWSLLGGILLVGWLLLGRRSRR